MAFVVSECYDINLGHGVTDRVKHPLFVKVVIGCDI